MIKSNIPKEFEHYREEIEEQDQIAKELDQIKKKSPFAHDIIVQDRAEKEATAIRRIRAYKAKQSKALKERKAIKAKRVRIASKGGIAAKQAYDKTLMGKFYIAAIEEVNRLIDAGEVRANHFIKNKSETIISVCKNLLKNPEFKDRVNKSDIDIDYEKIGKKTKRVTKRRRAKRVED